MKMLGTTALRLCVFCAVIAMLVAVPVLAAPYSALPGKWEGSIEIQQTSLDVIVRFAESDEGLRGTVDFPMQKKRGLPVSDLTVDSTGISFAVPGMMNGVAFSGTLMNNDSTLAGDFLQDGQTYPFSLTLTEEIEPEEAAEEEPVDTTEAAKTEEAVQEDTPEKPEWITTDTGLKMRDIVTGTGAEASNGDTVEVHYTGWFWNDDAKGDIFDSSHKRNATFSFTLGEGQVIKGWDEGVVGMKAGGKRELLIPSDLAYGDRGHPAGIPPKATLFFEVELISVK